MLPSSIGKHQFQKHVWSAPRPLAAARTSRSPPTDGSHYMITLDYTSNTLATNTAEGPTARRGPRRPPTAAAQTSQQSTSYPQPIGTVRAYPMPGGRVGIIVDGSTQNTELAINPLGLPQKKGFAHSFAYGESNRGHV